MYKLQDARLTVPFWVVVLVSLAGLLAACDDGPIEDPRNTNVACELGLVASTSGELLQTFPLTSTQAPEPIGPGAATHLTAFGDRLALANGPAVSKVFDLERGRPLLDLPAAWSPSAALGHEDVYISPDQTGPYAFTEQITLESTLLGSSIRALRISASGDTSSAVLRSASLRRIDTRRYATTRFIKALPRGTTSDVIFFQEDEIITVTTDSLGTMVFEDRFDFERSLWQLSPATGASERLLTLPDPRLEGTIRLADVTPDGRHLVYDDGGGTYYVNLDARTVKIIKEGTLEGSGEEFALPVLAPDGEFVMGLRSTCPQDYMAENLQTGEEWFVLNTFLCDYNTATFAPDGDDIYFTDVRRDSIGVWRVPRTNRIRGHSGGEIDHAVLIARFTETLDIVERPHDASLSNPAFLSPNEFAVLHTYDGYSDVCR